MTNPRSLQGKKVILVFGSLDLGGAERQGLILAESLKNDYGADVRVWGLRDEPGRLSELCDEKVIRWRGVKCGWGKYAFTRVAKLARFAGVLRKERPDLVLSYTRLPNLICGIVWSFSGARAMVWNQRDEGLLLTRGFWERLAVRRTPHFVSNSGRGKTFLQDFYRVPAAKISVIRNGVVLADPVLAGHEWRKLLRIPEDALVACMVANIHPYKDHRTLIRAWARVAVPNGPLPFLVLAGRIDEGGEVLRKLAGELGIEDRVIFAGKVDDISGLLNFVDLCIHSSISEGSPNSVLEAMAAGRPVVGTDIPGIREAVGTDGVPFLAPVGDIDALASRIEEVLADAQLRERLGRMMRERVSAEFSVSSMCREMAALLCAVLSC